VIESECIVGAGALITEGKRFERGGLIVGAPGRVVRQVTEEERQMLRVSAVHYAEEAARYAAELRSV
jgi:carbonic anhydrase/acetyltransferase-like protein (isoleucine patch superfamily)